MRKVKNTRAKGAAFERKVKKDLEDKGWFVVRQAASAFPDLIAFPPMKEGEPITFMEIKWNLGTITDEEIEKLVEIECDYPVRTLILFKNGPKYIEKCAMKHPFGHIIYPDELKILKKGRKNAKVS